MERKLFLKKSALGIGGAYLLPYWLMGCKKENPFLNKKFNGSVGIVGAGAAGIYAGYLLQQQGINVEIYEASPRVGGRMRTLEGFADFNIDLGAEYIHGERSLWYDAARASGAQFIDDSGSDYYFFQGQLFSENEFTARSEYNALNNVFEGISGYNGADISAATYATVAQLPVELSSIFNGWVGNENGTDNNEVGMTGLALADVEWSAGEENFIIKNKDLLGTYLDTFQSVLSKVKVNTPIASIDYRDGNVKLTSSSGEVYEKNKVLVTSSINVLFSQMIDFSPGLPSTHLQAIGTIKMGAGLKIILKFNQAFWSSNMRSLYGGTLVPEYWNTGFGGKSATGNILTAFVNGSHASTLLALGEEMIPSILSELNMMFGNSLATDTFVDSYRMNWSEEPYIKGTYSYPTVGLSADARSLLSVPIANKLYFAGEACAESGHHGTIHGAMESALFAVNKILETA